MDVNLTLERLEKLASFLDKLEPSKLTMNQIVDEAEMVDGRICGTACCAWGWCPAVFPEELAWKPWSLQKSPHEAIESHDVEVFPIGDPPNGRNEFVMVAADFFGITNHQARELFMPSSYGAFCGNTDIPPERVVRKIRDLIGILKDWGTGR